MTSMNGVEKKYANNVLIGREKIQNQKAYSYEPIVWLIYYLTSGVRETWLLCGAQVPPIVWLIYYKANIM